MTARVLVAVDLTAASARVCQAAGEFARLLQAEVVLLNVVHELAALLGVYGQQTVTALQQRVEQQGGDKLRALAREHFGDLPHRVVLQVGTPWAEILDCAAQENVDLLVLGTHAGSKPEHAFVGSTVKRVIDNAHCRILLVPPA